MKEKKPRQAQEKKIKYKKLCEITYNPAATGLD